jgi:hypothetical protein
MSDFFHIDPVGGHTANQELVDVKSHVRTAPDGIEQNNLSYEGPDKMPVNGEFVGVKSHVRTSPDEFVENNLSYTPYGGDTGLQTIIHHDDPLKHVHQYKMDPLMFD